MSTSIPASSSPLATYYNEAKNYDRRGRGKPDTITIHCIVGQWTAKQGCDYFATTDRDASCNYVVGKDGSIGVSVPENCRSYCTSNEANDMRAVTIETASDTSSPYAVTDEALQALIKLITDICKRNGIKKLVWSTNKNERVNHLNGCNMTVHRDYDNKACPGDYLYNKHGEIAEAVNKLLLPIVYIENFYISTVTESSITSKLKLMEAFDQYSWSYSITDLLSGTVIDKDFLVKKQNSDLTIEDLYANTPYALIVKATGRAGNEIRSPRLLFNTTPDYPGAVPDINVSVDDFSDLNAAKCTISFSQPNSWGVSPGGREKGYRVCLAVNGKLDTKNFFDNLIKHTGAGKLTITKKLTELFNKTPFTYEDSLQIGIQTWVSDRFGNKVLNRNGPVFSPSFYIVPKAIPVNNIFIEQDNVFYRTTLFSSN